MHYSSRHVDLPVAPQFPFGHGLYYKRFRITRLSAPPTFAAGDAVTVEAEVVNDGEVAGEETVFLFVRDPVARIARPVLELKGFAKVALAPGAATVVRFTLEAEDFGYLDEDLKPRIDPGAFEILVGRSADRDRLTATTITLLA